MSGFIRVINGEDMFLNVDQVAALRVDHDVERDAYDVNVRTTTGAIVNVMTGIETRDDAEKLVRLMVLRLCSSTSYNIE